MLKDRNCQHCNKEFLQIEGKIFSNHVKWCNSNPKSPKNNKIDCEYCRKLIDPQVFSEHKIVCKRRLENRHPCLTCSKIIPEHLTFCNTSCSASYNNQVRIDNGWTPSEESRNKCRISRIKYEENRLIGKCSSLEYKNCVICNSIFICCKNKGTKTCSAECRNKRQSNLSKANPNCGGETNYRKYKYKGIIMDSSWEVKIAEYMDEKVILWERSRKLMFWWKDKKGCNRRYYPDFYLPEYDIYIDTKNKYLMKQDADKIKSVIEINKIDLFVGDVKYIKEIINKYGPMV